MDKRKYRRRIGSGLKFGLFLFTLTLVLLYLHRSDFVIENNGFTVGNVGKLSEEQSDLFVASGLASSKQNTIDGLENQEVEGVDKAEINENRLNPEVEQGEDAGEEAGEEIMELEGAGETGAGGEKEVEAGTGSGMEQNIVMRRAPRFAGPNCKNFTLSLYRPKTFNLTALVSYPGSGNTWLRHLIEYATGIYTGSMYCDFDLFGKGFVGEIQPWDSGSTIVQKLHYQYSDELPFKKGVLLLREPYKATISFAQYLEGGHTGRASIEVFKDKGWPSFAIGQAHKWTMMAKSWLEAGIPLHVVHYEHLLEDPTRELRKVCEFLGNNCEHLSTDCFKSNTDGQFHRRGTQKLLVPFLPLVRRKVDKSIDYISNLLIKHGHEPIPVLLYKYYGLSDDHPAATTADGALNETNADS